MPTKNGYLTEKGTGTKLAVETLGSLVKDEARNQALSASLVNMIERNALGYPAFSTVTPYVTGDVVFYDRKLYKFTDDKSAGDWDATKVAEFSVKEYTDAVKNYSDTTFAKKDGYYSQLTAGSAENLVGQTVDSEAYLIRPTGGAKNEVTNGIAYVEGMEGNSCVWNQLVSIPSSSISTTANGVTFIDNRDGSYTFYTADGGATAQTDIRIVNGSITSCILGHKYLQTGIRGGSSSTYRFVNKSSSSTGNNASYPIIFTAGDPRLDITLRIANGAVITTPVTIKPQVIDLTLLDIDNPTSVAQVAEWLAQHVGTKPYYAYNAGTILSAQTLGIKTYGQNLLNPTTKQAKLIPYEWEENSNVYTIKNVPSGATATFTPDNTGVAVTVDISGGSLDITSYGSGILELSAATADTYVCMKWDGTKDDDVVPYEDPHTYDFNVTKVYGKVNGEGEYVQCYQNGMQNVNGTADLLKADEAISRIGKRAYQSGDESDATVLTDKTNTLYVLETSVTYTDLVYRDNGVDTPLGEFLLRMQVNNWSMEEQNVTPYVDGQPTAIPATISTVYAIDAVEQIDTLNKTCYFADDVKANLQALLTCINTNCSETLGGTFSIGDPTQEDSKVFTFTFTANTEPEP